MKHLPPRALQMLQLLISDYSLAEAADAMGIPLSTADKYAAKIRAAFDCHTTCGAVAQAVAGGHVTPTKC